MQKLSALVLYSERFCRSYSSPIIICTLKYICDVPTLLTSVHVGVPNFSEQGRICVHVRAVWKSLKIWANLKPLINPVNP